MFRHTWKILQYLLQDFYSVTELFRIFYIKGLKKIPVFILFSNSSYWFIHLVCTQFLR